jgi:hypothetical protein
VLGLPEPEAAPDEAAGADDDDADDGKKRYK